MPICVIALTRTIREVAAPFGVRLDIRLILCLLCEQISHTTYNNIKDMAEACSSKSKRMSECWMVLEVCCYEVPSHPPPPPSTDGHLLLLLPPSNQITAREGKKGLSKMDDRTSVLHDKVVPCTKSQNPSQLFQPIVLCLSLCPWKRVSHACMRWERAATVVLT